MQLHILRYIRLSAEVYFNPHHQREANILVGLIIGSMLIQGNSCSTEFFYNLFLERLEYKSHSIVVSNCLYLSYILSLEFGIALMAFRAACLLLTNAIFSLSSCPHSWIHNKSWSDADCCWARSSPCWLSRSRSTSRVSHETLRDNADTHCRKVRDGPVCSVLFIVARKPVYMMGKSTLLNFGWQWPLFRFFIL